MGDDNKPLVTGISPAEGPPGTLVKIRGENLGKNENDVEAIFICNVNCSYTKEWKSSRLIHARTNMGFGNGDIKVATKSGGVGTSLVKFRGIMPRVGLLTEAAVWVDESKLFEEKPTANLSTIRNFAPNSTYTDPLGVAPEETGAVLPADKIEEWYPKTSSNPLSEEFDPSRFLLERHLDTSFDSLKSGYYHLQSKDTRTSVGPTSLVRGHLTTILDALHTLNEVNEMHEINESESTGGNICEELQGVLKSCNFVSNSLFNHILSRKDDADVKRNVLNVLHRYRFLFNLPRSIEKSIQQREYEILISDYNRAKALFQNTEVHSFKRALLEVDQKIKAFSIQLKQKLFDFPTPLEEQKKIIRYLNDLDYPGNAGWECITKQALWIKSMLLDCQVEHQMEEQSSKQILTFLPVFGIKLTTESRPTGITDTNRLTFPPSFSSDMQDWNGGLKGDRFIYSGSKQTNPTDSPFQLSKSHQKNPSLPESLQKVHPDVSSKPPSGILMVGSLCDLVTQNLSDLWSLGQTYLSNQLGEKRETGGKTINERDEFQAIVKDVIVVFCEMVQTVLLPDHLGKLSVEKERQKRLLVPWLPSAVKSVRLTLERLSKLGLSPDIISPLKILTTNAIGDCIKKVLSASVEEIHQLSDFEKWTLEYSQTTYVISQLPGLFEKKFVDSVRFARDYMTDAKIDNKGEGNTVHQDVITLLGEMLEAFLLAMEKTVFPDISSSNEQIDSLKDITDADSPKDTQVLVLLSNCEHVKENVIPRVIEQCVKNGFEDIQQLQEEIDIALKKLDNRVFSTFVEMKGKPLIDEIELGMNLAEYSWDSDKEVKGVRRYIKDILMNLTVIHHQVSSVSLHFIDRVLIDLCAKVVEEFVRIFECVQSFSAKGSLQAHLELNALRQALETYSGENVCTTIDGTLKRIPPPQGEDKKSMEEMLASFKNSMRYQLATFCKPDEESPADPKDLSLRQRAESMDMLNIRTKSLDKTTKAVRERAQTKNGNKKPKKKKSSAYKIEVEKSVPQQEQQLKTEKQPVEPSKVKSSLQPVSSQEGSAKTPTTTTITTKATKKTKRRAPAPPASLQNKSTDNTPAASNPFLEEENNPFLDDDDDFGNEDSTNPFLDGETEDSSNPFLD